MVCARTICWLDGKVGDTAIAPSLPVLSWTQPEAIITTTRPCPSCKEPRGHPSVTLVPLLCHCLLQIRNSGPADSTVQFIFYQPIIHRWRETDFFPCSATCGGGNGAHLVQELLASLREDSAVIKIVTSAYGSTGCVRRFLLSEAKS